MRRPSLRPPPPIVAASSSTLSARELKPALKLELMRVDVRQIKDVDQIAQTFHARVFVQFRIANGALDEVLCKGLDERGTEPELKSARWFLEKLEWHNAASLPTVVTKMVNKMGERDLSLVLEVEGEFLETFELENFPIDYQELTIKLRTACAREGGMPCEFCQHSMKSSALNVDTANFSLKNVWRLEPNIDATITTHHAMAGRSYPCLFLTAHVHRKPGFYVVNVVAPMGLFALMTMLRFRIDFMPSRLGFCMTLLLTSVAYKFVAASSLPAISYLTLLDKFVVSCSVIILISIFEHAFTLDHEFDYVMGWITASCWAVTHLFFGLAAWRLKRRHRRHRRKREADRLNEKTLSRAASVYNLRTSVSDAMNDAVADAKADLRDLRDAAAEIVLSVSSPNRSPSPNALGRHAILGTATPGSASGSPMKNRRSPHGRSPLATLDA